MKKLTFIVVALMMMLPSTLSAEDAYRSNRKKTSKSEIAVKEVKNDLFQKLQNKAIKDEGFFNVYQMEGKYYFEIPDSLLDREMLMITRREKTSMDLGFPGELIFEKVLTWAHRNDVIDLRVESYRKIANKGSRFHDEVERCMEPAIIKTLSIEGYSKDSTSYIVDVTDLFTSDILAYDLSGSKKKEYALGSIIDKSSYIEKIKSFPTNIEVSSMKTYNISGESYYIEKEDLKVVTLGIRNSLLLLPEEPMMPRYADERVGLFSHGLYDYSDDYANRSKSPRFIHRWRLEPSDEEAFRAGKLVEPKKPIVFYISPSVPERYQDACIQAIEDWQPAFERAGFKNAIRAYRFPTKEEDPEFDPLDARYSIIEYLPSYLENAYGPRTFDPRSGEILATHVCIFHNVQKYIRELYTILVGPVDKRAQKPVLDEDLMNRLMRYIVCHEVGHTLGLMHNFGASSAFPVDSLRSATFTQANGTTPSIMDYARFNYIAQPGDMEKGVYLIPIVGEYDKYAIEWAYRPILDAKSPEDERPILEKFIRDHAEDPNYLYVRQFIIQNDPRGIEEDLGDDHIKASEYAMKNLKIVFDNLENWTMTDGDHYGRLEDMYAKCLRQWVRYNRHVASYLGNYYENPRTYGQKGEGYHYVAREKQKEAVEFLSHYAIEAPDWIINQPYLEHIDRTMIYRRHFMETQGQFVHRLLNVGTLLRMNDAYEANPEEAYGPGEYLKDVRHAIWKDLYGSVESEYNRRTLQRLYLTLCDELVDWKSRDSSPIRLDVGLYEYKVYVRMDLQELKKDIEAKLKRTKDNTLREHYKISIDTIENILENK